MIKKIMGLQTAKVHIILIRAKVFEDYFMLNPQKCS